MCIRDSSYLTIELRDTVPLELRDGLDDWVFGCDICQEVCPWNRAAPLAQENQFAPDSAQNPLDVVCLFDLDETAFRERFRHTPLWRSKRRGLLRNAAIVLGNRPSDRGLEALLRGLDDQEMIVRAAVAWALGRHRQVAAADALRARLATESEPAVRTEIESALGR